MKLLAKRIGIVLLASSTALFSCADDPVKIKLMVISTVKGFNGHYLVNGESLQSFSAIEDAYGIALYEKEIEDVDYLEVSATTVSGATSIEIKVYKDNKKVKSNDKTIENPYDSTFIKLDYTPGDEEEQTTT